MYTNIRTSVLSLLLLAGLCGCGAISSDVSSTAGLVSRPFHHNATPATAAPPSAGLNAYKALVAHQVMERNPERVFIGRLPEMLPAIVVLSVTVDKNGALKRVDVQRSRDPNASRVAVESMRRSGPLPKPQNLIPRGDAMTFSETFLFDERYRFQLRSVAGR